MHAPHDDVLAQHGIDEPERGIPNRHVLDQHALAGERLQQRRPEIRAVGINSFFDRHTILGVGLQPGARRTLAFARLSTRGPGPPVRGVGAAVDRPAARDRDIRFAAHIDQRRVAHELEAFPVRQHGRQVAGGLGNERECRAVGDMELHVRAEMDRACRIAAAIDENAAAAGCAARRDGRLDRRGSVGARRRAEIANMELCPWNLWRANRPADIVGQGPVVGMTTCRAAGHGGRKRRSGDELEEATAIDARARHHGILLASGAAH
jgi:hypothetical protein